jgi:hypothetical protein
MKFRPSYGSWTGNISIYTSNEIIRWNWQAEPLNLTLPAATHRLIEVDLANFDDMPSRFLDVQLDLDIVTPSSGSTITVHSAKYRERAGFPLNVKHPDPSFDEYASFRVLPNWPTGQKTVRIAPRFYDSPRRKMYLTVRHITPSLSDPDATVLLSLRVEPIQATEVSIGQTFASTGGPDPNDDPFFFFKSAISICQCMRMFHFSFCNLSFFCTVCLTISDNPPQNEQEHVLCDSCFELEPSLDSQH